MNTVTTTPNTTTPNRHRARSVGRRLAAAAMALMLSVGVVTTVDATNNDAGAATNCQSTSYIKGFGWTFAVHSSGAWIAFQKDSQNFQQGVHIYANGQYYGFHPAPLNLGPIQLHFEQKFRFETWNGSVRQTNNPELTLTTCDGWRIVN